MSNEENELSINTGTNIDLESLSEPKIAPEEKSTFERAIIEAFKQSTSKECKTKLTIALEEVKFLVEDVKSSHGKKFLLNKNLINKLSRIIERRYFNINILIAKIFDSLLETSNFQILSEDNNLLISFSNEILHLLDIIKSTNISQNLEKKCSCFLNFLLKNPPTGLEDEQRDTIQELLYNFPTRNSSDSYKNFENFKEQILSKCKSTDVETKISGIYFLMESFSLTNSLEEQFDLLLEFCPAIIKACIHQPNPENSKLYYHLGNFIISMLYSFEFQINVVNFNKIPQNQNIKAFFLLDPPSTEPIQENKCNHMAFLQDARFELTSQKNLLIKCENIFSIANLIVNTLSIYETIFDLQFVCYLILKKIYFTFPQFHTQIGDQLAMILINICAFKKEPEKTYAIECKQFLHYLLQKGNDSLKEKLNQRIEAKGENIETSLKESQLNPIDVEFDVLNFKDFNLRIGYPNSYTIEAGGKIDKYIEVDEPNSLVYVGFATSAYDINCYILKYIEDDNQREESNNGDELTDKGHFKEFFKLERINCSQNPVKIVILAKNPGIYKLVYDNSYSWITSKTVKHRLSILKPLTEIDYSNKPKVKEENKESEKKEEKNNDIALKVSKSKVK